VLAITDAAAEQICVLLKDAKAADDTAVRILAEGNRVTLKLDEMQADDATFERDGRTILVLDQPTSELLSNETLDVKATEEGPRLCFS
jgi:Fe-S cluster assembly iron-binding protein IscA